MTFVLPFHLPSSHNCRREFFVVFLLQSTAQRKKKRKRTEEISKDNMDFILNWVHGFLNHFAYRMTLTALLHFMPIYLLFKCLHYILRSMFSENVARKVVLITGASSGIGEHLAYEYARRGSYLVLAARRKNSLREVSEIAQELGSPSVLPVYADVTRAEDCERLVEKAIEHFGQLDHVVTNAGVTPVSLLEDLYDIDNFLPAMDTNFWGSAYVTYYTVPHLKRSKGKIVVIASSASWLHAPRMSFYNVASKAAVVSFYETLRVEFGSDIGVTIVTPGLIESEMTKGKFLTMDGKLEVDQDMRDVLVSVLPVELAANCARAAVNAACRGDKYLTVPAWIKSAFPVRVLCPEVIEWLNRWFLLPQPGRPPTEALSKKLLDWTGIKEYIYPESILSPGIKID